MSGWSADELAKIAAAEELRIAGRRRDGSLRGRVTTWVVTVGDEVYVRSVNGRDGPWFRGTQATHEGRIAAGGVDRDVTFIEADADVAERVDTAYREKYHRYPANIVNSVLTPAARSATLTLTPV